MAIEVTPYRTPSIRVFSYGLDLDLSLLHTILGGPKPSCGGPSRLFDCRRNFAVSGHLPGLEPHSGASVAGAITLLTSGQLQRMDGWLVGYQRHRLVLAAQGGRERLVWYYAPSSLWKGPGRPSLATLTTILRGVADRGLSDPSPQHLAHWRPNDRTLLDQAIDKNLVFSA